MTVTTAFPATLLKSHLEVDAADRFAARGLCELSVRGPCVACTAVRSGRWVEWSAVASGKSSADGAEDILAQSISSLSRS